MLARLQGKEAPSFHINTTTAEEVPSYRIDYKFEDGREICFDVAKGVNVGGEEDNREDDWGSALKKATLIFYLIDTPKLLETIKTLPEGTEYRLSTLRKASPYFKRLIEDMRFVAASLHGKRLAVILNKIDLLPEDEDPQTLEEFIKPLVSEGLQGAKTSLRSVRPLSCQNKEIFESCFPIILKDISGY